MKINSVLFENFDIGYLAEDSLNKKLKTMFKRKRGKYHVN